MEIEMEDVCRMMHTIEELKQKIDKVTNEEKKRNDKQFSEHKMKRAKAIAKLYKVYYI
jgi:hypothetical protein